MTRKKILKEIKQWYEDVQERYKNRKEGTEAEFEMDVLFVELSERISKLKSDESEES